MKTNNEIYNVLFCGTGGQGVLKASEVCGMAAMLQGHEVKKSEVHGMSQRGGSVESHLRFGTNVHSPLIMPGNADFLVCFHDGEAKRLRNFLKTDGLDFSKYLPKLKELSDPRFTNTLFLGILASKLNIKEQIWLDALKTVVTHQIEENRRVFEQGMQLGRNS